MECSDFMQQLRSFKPQSLGCAVARRKSSTTLIFPLPPQACSGKYFYFRWHRRQDRSFIFPPFTVAPHFRERGRCSGRRRLLQECICMRRSYRWFRPPWITRDYTCKIISSPDSHNECRSYERDRFVTENACRREENMIITPCSSKSSSARRNGSLHEWQTKK